jgi:hypothetical protein
LNQKPGNLGIPRDSAKSHPALNGIYQYVPPKHLKRYVGEIDARYNTREMTDMERTEKVVRGAIGKRITYRCSRPRQSDNSAALSPPHL